MINKDLLTKYQTRTTSKRPVGEARTYREKLVSDIQERLNECRTKAGYSPMSYPRVAKMVKGFDEVQLKRLYDDCICPTIPFSALFFSKLKKQI